MEKILTFKVDPKKFDIKKEYRVRDLKNFETWSPCVQGSHFMESALKEKFWTNQELLQVADG